jgi:hypothetical protein
MAVLDIGKGAFRALPRYLSGTTFQLAFDPRGRMLVAAGHAQLRLFDLSGDLAPNKRRASAPLRFGPSAVDITPDGRLRAVGEEHGELSFWELASLTELVRVAAHQGPVLALRTSPAAT